MIKYGKYILKKSGEKLRKQQVKKNILWNMSRVGGRWAPPLLP